MMLLEFYTVAKCYNFKNYTKTTEEIHLNLGNDNVGKYIYIKSLRSTYKMCALLVMIHLG